jgi:hypothetical protein
MKKQNSITPPLELLEQWAIESPIPYSDEDWAYELFIAHHAAQWGSDQELEACVKWLNSYIPGNEGDRLLRSARRPKPPSLKEQALQALSHLLDGAAHSMDTAEPADYIRRALEQLPDNE